jgi:hypothetical protein
MTITTTIIKENFFILGIRTKLDFAKLLWFANSTLNFNFVKAKDIEIINKKTEEPIFFPVFVSEMNNCILKIVANKVDTSFYKKQHKDFDFLLFIETNISENKEIETIIDACRAKFSKIDEITELKLLTK